MGDWSAMVKHLPRVTMRYGIRRNERALQTHEFDLVHSYYLPFPPCLSAELWLLLGCSIRQRLDRALLPLSPLDGMCGICATLTDISLSNHMPWVLFICFCSSPLPSFICKGPASSSHLLPLTIPFPHSLSSYLLKSGFLPGAGNVFISFWFSSCPITSHLILASFSLPLTCLSPLIPLLPCIS